jgi:hypothetical protein
MNMHTGIVKETNILQIVYYGNMILSEKKGMECMTVSLDYFDFYQHFFSLLLTNILGKSTRITHNINRDFVR